MRGPIHAQIFPSARPRYNDGRAVREAQARERAAVRADENSVGLAPCRKGLALGRLYDIYAVNLMRRYERAAAILGRERSPDARRVAERFVVERPARV